MKQRSTTPVSTSFAARACIVAASVLMLVATPLQFAPTAKADQYDDQINALEHQIDQYNKETAKLSKKADSLKNQLSKLTNQKAIIQKRLDQTQLKYDKLKKDIKQTKKDLADNKQALGDAFTQMYVEGDVSPIVMIAGSDNISDTLNGLEYQDSVRDQLTAKIKQVNNLKAKLEKQKVAVARTLKDQKGQRQALVEKENERQAVLAATNGKKAAYQKLTQEQESKIANLREQQRIAFEALQNPSGGVSGSSPTGYAITYENLVFPGGCGGYSYCNYGLDNYVADEWGLGYTRECVHYVADWLDQRGYYLGPSHVFAARGNANQWIPTATSFGFGHVVSTPQRGDVAYMAVPGVGHVGIVEQNYGNGWVKISQYNFATPGAYSTMDLKITGATQFLRFGR